jgi:AcrR family transcriptional regulator
MTENSSLAAAPALRVDAERNRLALVCAAATVFRRSGTSAPLDEVAREAHVGIATLYRRFPDRDSLIEAVFEEKMRDYADRAAAAAERALAEPWQALEEYVTHMMSEQSTDPAFADVIAAPLTGSRLFIGHHRNALTSTITLVERVKAAKVVRGDFEHADLFLLTLANTGISHGAGESAPEASRRLCAYMLESFKPTTSRTLPPVPPAWAKSVQRRSRARKATT